MADPRLGSPHHREIDFNEINDREDVGRGTFGTVYKARWRNTWVAIKEFDREADRKAIDKEVKQLSRVMHPNIIVLYGVSKIYSRTCLVMEYAEGGSLYKFLHTKPKRYYSAGHAMSWALQCAEGVAYLHAMKPKPLIHRDLKPPNLLLVNQGRTLKICDFGTVADKSTLMTNNKGSAAWMAPEVFETTAYTEKCDLFSWGIILWEVISREQPFKEFGHEYSIMWRVHQGQRPPRIEGCPKPIENLMTSCWDVDPAKRPPMDYVVKIMRILCRFFPGADEPLDCSSQPQEYYEPDEADDDCATIDGNTIGFDTMSTEGLSTPTNSAEVSQISEALSQQSISPRSNTQGGRWGSINSVNKYEPTSTNGTNRYEIIQNGMMEARGVPMQPLTIDVDPNAWELDEEEYNNIMDGMSKSDGKERLTVTDTAPVDETSQCTDTVDDTDSNYHLMLEPHLRPETPDPNDPQSQEIFDEHKKLAKEYFKVVTELYYAKDRKERILAAMDPQEREAKQAIIEKMRREEDLLEWYNNLKQQLERIQAGDRVAANFVHQRTYQQPSNQHLEEPPDQNDDGWVVVPSNHS